MVSTVATENKPLFGVDYKYVLFHPITAYIVGFLAFHLIPPFFSDGGHNWFIIFLDLAGVLFFSVGVVNGVMFKRMSLGATFKIKAMREEFTLLLLAFAVILYPFRIYRVFQEGIYALLHSYSWKYLSKFTTMYELLQAPYILLLWCGVFIVRKRYIFVLLFFEFLLQVASLSKTGVLFFAIYGIAAYAFLNALTMRRIRQFAIIIGVLLLVSIITGQYIHDVRSYAFTRNFDTAGEVEFKVSLTDSLKRFVDRMNTHGNYRFVAGNEEYLAEKDFKALKSIAPKLLGFDREYEVNPITLSYEAGIAVGLIAPSVFKTATEFPRSIFLYSFGGLSAVVLFSILSGAVFGFLFDIFYKSNNLMFIIFFFLLSLGFLVKATGQFVATTVFQLLFGLITFSIPIILFFVMRFFVRWMRGVAAFAF
ncbi:MAG: hypothetical protein AB1805_03400 [Nitrospirota bacterium]